MARNFGYYNDVAADNYDNNFYGQYNNPTNNWSNLALGAGLGYLLGFSPLVGLGFGALLSNNSSQNTNIININTGRRNY